MAKKVKKRRSGSVHPGILFVELLVPWIVMGIVAVALQAAGVKGITIIVFALASGLATTVFIGYYERTRKRRAARLGQSGLRRRP